MNPSSMIKQTKVAWKTAGFYWRWATGGRRPLPDVIIIGAMRSGTTSLLHWLGQHPQIRRSLKKEVHFFDVNYHRGARWYRAHFPRLPSPPAAEEGEQIRILESSPYYLYHPLVPQRLAELLPEVKLIALLRNPVDRALSHHYHEIAKGREELEALTAMNMEEQRLSGAEESLVHGAARESRTHRRYSYKSRGYYVEQLRRWEPWIRQDRLRIVQSEQLFSDPPRVLEEVYRFVGVDPHFRPPDLRARNVSESDRALAGPEVVAYLEDFFEPHNAELERFLGRDFGWDRERPLPGKVASLSR